MKISSAGLWFVFSVLALSSLCHTAARAPNVLLIVADDFGYADIGVFGSDVSTPNIDALASEGITFSNFHTVSSCATTRSMLLTGNNSHVAGIGRQSIRRGRV